MKKIKRISAILLILIMSLASQVFGATSASFNSNSYCAVTISQKLMNSKKYKTATVKITTYGGLGNRKTSGKINVKLTDGKGNYIGTYKKKSGDTIKLGNDHSSYRIYITPYNEPVTGGIFSQSIKSANNFDNLGKCVTWKVSNNKNCSIR